MLSFVKGFKTLIPKNIVMIILVVFCLFALIIQLEGDLAAIDFIGGLLPISLIIFAVLFLEYKGQTLAAHLVVFIMVFSDGLGAFFRAITAYNFGLVEFTSTLDWQMFIGLLICVYLMLYIASFILSGEYKFMFVKSILTFPLLLLSAYLYIRYGLGTLIVSFIPILIALSAGVPLSALALMLCQVINVPVDIMDRILTTDGIKYTSITYWLVSLGALFLIYMFVMLALKLTKKEEIKN